MKPAVVLAALVPLLWGPGPEPGREWREISYKGHTEYRVLRDSAGVRLAAESHGRHSALFHAVAPGVRVRTLAWRWRVLRHPAGADPSRRSGDDRAAAVFVLVHRSLLPWRTRGLVYQWSESAPLATWARSPYASEIRVLTLENAPAGDGWRRERRDVAADLREAFGPDAGAIEAIGVLCDTDDTHDRAVAEFGEIECEVDSVRTGPR